jgi:hypothetical protein
MSEAKFFSFVNTLLLNLFITKVKFQLKCIGLPFISQQKELEGKREDSISIQNCWELIRNYMG